MCHAGPLNAACCICKRAHCHSCTRIVRRCCGVFLFFFAYQSTCCTVGYMPGLVCVCVRTHTRTRGAAARVNGVFDWNRMTVGIHAGFPLLNSAIRLTVYGSADFSAHLADLLPACVCVPVCVSAPKTCYLFTMMYSSGDCTYKCIYRIRASVCICSRLNQCL